jgi:cytochrome c-type biogenesis protein CcmH
MLWALLILMTVVAAVGLVVPLVRRRDGRRGHDPGGVGPGGVGGTVEVLKSQLADLDAEVAARTLPDPPAEGLRTEIERRILAEGASVDGPARPIGERSLVILGLGVAAVVALGATGLYLGIGRPDLAAAPAAAPPGAATDAAHPGGDVAAMVAQLEARMKAAPGDPQGWRLLGWSYMQLRRYSEAATAYGRAAALDPASAEYPSARGEALTQAAGGQVTAQAQAAFAAALARDGVDPRARYFLAMARDQRGDHAGAMADWIALLKSAPPDAPWTADVRRVVERVAKAHGKNIADRLPPAKGTAPKERQLSGRLP